MQAYAGQSAGEPPPAVQGISAGWKAGGNSSRSSLVLTFDDCHSLKSRASFEIPVGLH